MMEQANGKESIEHGHCCGGHLRDRIEGYTVRLCTVIVHYRTL